MRDIIVDILASIIQLFRIIISIPSTLEYIANEADKELRRLDKEQLDDYNRYIDALKKSNPHLDIDTFMEEGLQCQN